MKNLNVARRPTLIKLFAVSVFTVTALACAGTADAQLLRRVFVDALNGANAGGCPLTAPCKTFAYAVNHVLPGGDVVVLTSGGYGPVTITKSLTLFAPAGIYASINAETAGVNAITINAPATATVTIRGLTLMGNGGDNGVLITQAGTVHIENCLISSFDGAAPNGNGIKLATAANLNVHDSIVRDNHYCGIYTEPTEGFANVLIDNVRVEKHPEANIYFVARTTGSISRSVVNGGAVSSGGGLLNSMYGIKVGNNTAAATDASSAVISHTVATGSYYAFSVWGEGATMSVLESTASHSNDGFAAISGADLTLEHVTSLNNGSGVLALYDGTVLRISNSTITKNYFGLVQGNNAILASRGNNTVRGNTSAETVGVISSYSPT